MIFCILFISLQLSVATLALFEPRPARWGWQMFSGVRTQASFASAHLKRQRGVPSPRTRAAGPVQ